MDEILVETNNFCAFTDLAMGIILAFLTVWFAKIKTNKAKQKKGWVALYSTLTLASFLGFAAHFLFIEGIVNEIIWMFLYPLFFVAMIFLTLTALASLKNEDRPTKNDILIYSTVGFVCYAISKILPLFIADADDIRLLTIFAAIYGLYGFFIFLLSAIKKGNTGEKCIFLSFLPILAGAYFEIQRNTLIHFIFYIDHNGITHLLFILGLVVLFFAGRICLKEEK